METTNMASNATPTRVYRNRFEEIEAYEKLMGWGPLTDEDRKALDDAVRMVTNLDSKPRYAVSI